MKQYNYTHYNLDSIDTFKLHIQLIPKWKAHLVYGTFGLQDIRSVNKSVTSPNIRPTVYTHV